MDLQLSGKKALITGGSTGIGAAVARKFASEGVDVMLCARNGQAAAEVAKNIADTFGVRAAGIGADMTREEDIRRLVDATAETTGGPDILFNNAGQGTNETILEAPDARWQYYWDLHVMAAVRLSRAICPGMKARGGGVILNNASICASQPLYYEPIYNVTKAALVMFSKCLANEVIGDHIRVNSVNPGLILTPSWENTARQLTEGTQSTWQEYLDAIARDNAPIGRFASSDELADFIVFLCSPRASYCVGSSYYVDGGWLKVVN